MSVSFPPRPETIREIGEERRRRTAMRNAAIFLMAFAAFEAVLDRVAPPFQGATKVAKKFAYFAAHKDEYDVVFVGSSRVMNQISPHEFDAQMAAAGRPCRSFNLGFAGMFLPECTFLIDRVRALHPARLRTMVIEMSNPAPRHDAAHPLTERDIYWHRAGPTLLACAAVWTDPDFQAAPWQRSMQVFLQTAIFARCAVHLGCGPQLLNNLRKLTPAPDQEIVGPGADGFFPLRHTLGGGQSHAAKTGGTAADRLAFQNKVERLRLEHPAGAGEAAAIPRSPMGRRAWSVLRALLARQFGALGRDGIRPLAFIGPGTTREQGFLDLRADGTLPTLLAFNDPDAHPDLYALDVRGIDHRNDGIQLS